MDSDNLSLTDDYLLDNEILSKIDIIDYDINRTYFRVCKYLKKYRRLKGKHYEHIPIKITTKYKYIYIDEGTKSNNEYNEVDKYIDRATEYDKMSKEICLITNTFSQEELVYFTICLYQQRSETRAFKEIGCSNNGLIPIKNSCIIKFATALDIEVYKNEGFYNDEEEVEYQNFLGVIGL